MNKFSLGCVTSVMIAALIFAPGAAVAIGFGLFIYLMVKLGSRKHK